MTKDLRQPSILEEVDSITTNKTGELYDKLPKKETDERNLCIWCQKHIRSAPCPEAHGFMSNIKENNEKGIKEANKRFRESLEKEIRKSVAADYKDTNPKDLSFGKKPPMTLVPPAAIILIAKVNESGALKRSAYNWRESKITIMQTLDKTLRHVYKYLDGQDNDEETGLSELAHAAADLTILIDAIENNCVVDDRPKKGNSADLIKKLTKE